MQKIIIIMFLLVGFSSKSIAEISITIDAISSIYQSGPSNLGTIKVWPTNSVTCGSMSFSFFELKLGVENATSSQAFSNYTTLLNAAQKGLSIGIDESNLVYSDDSYYIGDHPVTGESMYSTPTKFYCTVTLNQNSVLKIYYP